MALLALLLPALSFLVSFSAAAAPTEGDWPLPVTFTTKDLEDATLKDLKSRMTDYIRGGILAKDQIECKFGSQFLQEVPAAARAADEITPTYITSSLTLWFKWEWRQAQRWTDAFGEYNFGPKDLRISCISPANGYFFDPTDCQFNLHKKVHTTDRSPHTQVLQVRESWNITAHYSAMALSLPTNNASGVAFKSANRFYINESISLKKAYQDQVESDYQVKVEKANFREKTAVVSEVNNFVSEATNGMITNIINNAFITDDMLAMFINAIFFHGQWKFTFGETHKQTFNGISGERTMDFMSRKATFGVNWNDEGSTALVLPYKDESYKFFFLMANKPSDFTNMLTSLSGQQLLDTLHNAEETNIEVIVPKFRVQSDLNAVPVLKSMGVSHLFDGSANLSKISEAPLAVSAIKHVALIEVSEEGTTAAAATVVGMVGMAMPMPPPITLVIDQPFIYGIMKNDDILFIGQFV